MLEDAIKERVALRDKVLSSLYDYHFANNGAPYRTTKDELKDAPEEILAYDYLIEKGFVHHEKQGLQFLVYKITAHGIDYFESKFQSE